MDTARFAVVVGLLAFPCGLGILVLTFRSRSLSSRADSPARVLWDIAVSIVAGVLMVTGAALTVGGAALLDL